MRQAIEFYACKLLRAPIEVEEDAKRSLVHFDDSSSREGPAGIKAHIDKSRKGPGSIHAVIWAASCCGPYTTLCALRATLHSPQYHIGHNSVVTRVSTTALDGAVLVRLTSSLTGSLRNVMPHHMLQTAKHSMYRLTAAVPRRMVRNWPKHLKSLKLNWRENPWPIDFWLEA
jgi:hypothetical protein